MDRRDFLKLAASGLTAATAVKEMFWQPRTLRAETARAANLSLSVITDRPEQAIAKLQALFRQAGMNSPALAFEECLLPGVHVGDIVLMRNNALIDYRQPQDGFSRNLYQISRELGVPREVKNPILLKFSTPGSSQNASTVNVYHRQALVQQFDLNDQVEGEKIKGTKGELHVTLNHRHMHIAAASCKHKTCMNMGSISRPGQTLVCIPNELRIVIGGTDQRGIDGVTL